MFYTKYILWQIFISLINPAVIISKSSTEMYILSAVLCLPAHFLDNKMNCRINLEQVCINSVGLFPLCYSLDLFIVDRILKLISSNSEIEENNLFTSSSQELITNT